MDMQKCTIYVRLYKRTTVQKSRAVTISQLADVAAPPEIKAKVDSMVVFNVPDGEHKSSYVVTIVDVINCIWHEYPKADVQSIGDPDAVIEYHPTEIKQRNLLEWLKVAVVCVIVFAGAVIAIMTYNTDTSLGQTFTALNKMITGETNAHPYYMTIPYAIGITAGVILFFNHFGKRSITKDPTPMQVEMNIYEKDVQDCEIDKHTDRRRNEP